MSKYDFQDWDGVLEKWWGEGWRIGDFGDAEKIWLVFLRRKTAFFLFMHLFCCFFFPIFLIVCPSYFLGSFSERSLDRLRSLENFYLTAKIYVAWTALFSTMYRERRQLDKCLITYTFQVFCFTIRSPTLTIDSTKVACAITVVFCDVFFIVTASCSIYTWIAITRIGLNWNHQYIATCWNLS